MSINMRFKTHLSKVSGGLGFFVFHIEPLLVISCLTVIISYSIGAERNIKNIDAVITVRFVKVKVSVNFHFLNRSKD